MAERLASSTFTAVHVAIDVDGDASTGVVNGRDLWIAAAVGSRFVANDWKPARPGVIAPIDARRTALNEAFVAEIAAGGERYWNWRMQAPLAPPRVDGNRIHFEVEKETLRASGIGATMRFQVQVDTGMSDQPIVIGIEGDSPKAPTKVDGARADWPKIGRVADAADLHPSHATIDILSVAALASGETIWLGLDCAAKGFLSQRRAANEDVGCQDAIAIHVLETDGRSEEPASIRLARGEARLEPPVIAAQGNDGFIEIALSRRTPGAGARITIWTEGSRWDTIGESDADLVLGITP